LGKSYDKLEAVKAIAFQVHEGEVFGLLGPNGAGKTSTVEILEGLRPRGAEDRRRFVRLEDYRTLPLLRTRR
jgi:ABC-type multidrug transport system ATPase subunit